MGHAYFTFMTEQPKHTIEGLPVLVDEINGCYEKGPCNR